MRVLITTNSKHGLCLESVNNMLITTFVNNELITLPTLFITTNSEHGPCSKSVNNTLLTTFVINELITLPTLGCNACGLARGETGHPGKDLKY